MNEYPTDDTIRTPYDTCLSFEPKSERIAWPCLRLQITYYIERERIVVSKQIPVRRDDWHVVYPAMLKLRDAMRDLTIIAKNDGVPVSRQAVDDAARLIVSDAKAKWERQSKMRYRSRMDVANVWLRVGGVDPIAKSHYKQYQWIAS